MPKRCLLLASVILLFGAGCAQGIQQQKDIPPQPLLEVKLGEEFVLQKGQTAKVKDADVYLTVTGFINSPCPDGAQCIWSGLAVLYELRIGDRIYTTSDKGILPSPPSDYQVLVKDSDYANWAKFVILELFPPPQEEIVTDEDLREAEQDEARRPISKISEDEAPPPPPNTMLPFILQSSAFASGAVIPGKYSCDGQDINPPLSWSGAPEGTKSFAVIVDDPDAVQVVGKIVDHWVVWNIPAATTSIAEGSVPAGASQGMGYDAPKYQGPCPPSGTTHRYVFKLYALDLTRLDLPSSTSGKTLESAMQGHVLKQAEFIGHFTAK